MRISLNPDDVEKGCWGNKSGARPGDFGEGIAGSRCVEDGGEVAVRDRRSWVRDIEMRLSSVKFSESDISPLSTSRGDWEKSVANSCGMQAEAGTKGSAWIAHSSGIFLRLFGFLTLPPKWPPSSQPPSRSRSFWGDGWWGLSDKALSLCTSVGKSYTSSLGLRFFFFFSFLRSDPSLSLSSASPAPLSLGDHWGSAVTCGLLSTRGPAWRLITVETLGVKGRSDGMPASSNQRSPKTPRMQRRMEIRAALTPFYALSQLINHPVWYILQSAKTILNIF